MSTRYAFATPGRPLVIEVTARDAATEAEGQALAAAVDERLPEWPLLPAEETPFAGEPVIAVERRGADFAFTYPGLPETPLVLQGPVAAADALASALISCYAQQDTRQVTAHAGAIAAGGGLVVLYGDSLAGKSTLAVLAAFRGRPLAADDRLVISVPIEGTPVGVALGTVPRMRLPLPPQVEPAFADFVEARRLRGDSRLSHLALHRPGEQLAAGSRLPVRALVALERKESGALEFSPQGQGVALRSFFNSFAAPHLGAEALTRRLHKLVRRVPSYRLGFANSTLAAELLIERFGGGR